MSTNNPYRLKDSIRCEFEVDKTQLQNFHALESGWHEIFHWLMSSDGKLSSDDNDKDHHEKISALWHNHVLTVLLDIRHKNLKSMQSHLPMVAVQHCRMNIQKTFEARLRDG